MKWNSGVYRVELSSDGREVTNKTLYSSSSNQNHLPNRGLDVLSGPGGAIVAVDYSLGKVRVQVPDDIAALGLTPYDIFPWRAPATGGQPFLIGGSGFGTNQSQVSVSIGGVPATITSVSDKRISGILPPSSTGLASELLDVVVTVGMSQRTIEDAMRYLPAVPGMGRGVWRPGVPLPSQLGEVASVVADGEILVFGQGDSRTLGFDPCRVPGAPFAPSALPREPSRGRGHRRQGVSPGWAGRRLRLARFRSTTWSPTAGRWAPRCGGTRVPA